MMKQLLPFIFLLILPLWSAAQQLPQRSPLGEQSFIWNPAMTATGSGWQAGVSHRQEWLGFEGAPQTTAVMGQYAVPKQRASVGGFFLLDKVQPVNTNVIGLTYAYKLGEQPRRRGRGSSSERQAGQLSLGLMATLNHIIVDAIDLVVNNPNDPFLPSGERDEFQPNLGAGLYYLSRPMGPGNRSWFFAGAAANQLFNSRLLLRDEAPAPNLQRAFHGNATLGYHYGGEQLHWEPNVWISVAGKQVVDWQIGIRAETEDAFWGGLTYSESQTLGIQLGYRLPAGTGQLQLGTLGTYNVGSFGPARGLGFEVYAGYRMEE